MSRLRLVGLPPVFIFRGGLQPGDTVEICGLVGAPQFNGTRATVRATVSRHKQDLVMIQGSVIISKERRELSFLVVSQSILVRLLYKVL